LNEKFFHNYNFTCATDEDIPPMQLKEAIFRCIMQLYDCLLTEVHERCKKGLSLAKRLNSSLAFLCYDLLSIVEPRQVFELVCILVNFNVYCCIYAFLSILRSEVCILVNFNVYCCIYAFVRILLPCCIYAFVRILQSDRLNLT
jgi:hypothetical protein